jgi:hypothetical protein
MARERWNPPNSGSELTKERGAIVHKDHIILRGKYGNTTISYKRKNNPCGGDPHKFFVQCLTSMGYTPAPKGAERPWPKPW